MCTCFLSHRPQLQIASSLKEGTVHYNLLCPIITLKNQVFKNGERTLSWVDIILSVPHSSLPSLYPLAAIFLYLCRLASPSGWPTLPPLWTVLTSLPLISASLWMACIVPILSLYLDTQNLPPCFSSQKQSSITTLPSTVVHRIFISCLKSSRYPKCFKFR